MMYLDSRGFHGTALLSFLTAAGSLARFSQEKKNYLFNVDTRMEVVAQSSEPWAHI